MRVESTIKMDLAQHQNIPTISVSQCDTNTRILHLFLYSNGIAWNVPDDALVALAYIRSDGSRGIYDTLPDGSSACRYQDNEMFATIVPQAISTVGETKIVIVFTNSSGQQLASFAISVNVLENPAIGAIEPEDYINLQQAIDESVKEAISEIGVDSFLVINISVNEENKYESDKSGSDIQTALESQKIVFCRFEASDAHITAPLVEVRDGKFYFGSIVNHYEWLVVLEDVVDADYNVTTNVQVDRFDKSSSGETPYIGDNGNWWIGEEDTGVKAAGEDGRSVYSVALDISQSDETKSVYSMSDDGDRTIGSFTVYHGAEGHTPVKGVDYFTEADKAEIIQSVIEAMGGVLVGTVNENNAITVTGALADGTYTLKYENADGTLTEIGSFTVGGETAPAYTNLFDPVAASLNSRWSNSSYSYTSTNGYVTTDFIPIPDISDSSIAHILRFRGGTWAGNASMNYYDASKKILSASDTSTTGPGIRPDTYTPTADENGDMQIALGIKNNAVESNWATAAYVRLTLQINADSVAITADDIADIVVTVDEPIE